MTTTDGTIGRYLRWLVVALSLAAGAIHLAEVGDHFNLSWKHGVFLPSSPGCRLPGPWRS